MMKILITRHGESLSNKHGLLAGSFDSPLTPLGQRQAMALVERLVDENNIDLAYSSNLSRALYTAEELCKKNNIKVIETPLLRERCFGAYENNSKEKYLQDALGLSPLKFDLNGVESLDLLRKRSFNALDHILRKSRSLGCRTILISGHHSINKMLLLLLQKKDNTSWLEIKQSNASVSRVDILPDGDCELCYIDCTKHLDKITLS